MPGDRSLYLMAAEALETRAQWLVAALPEDREERQPEERPRQIVPPPRRPPLNVIV